MWVFSAVVAVLITVCFAILYDDGRFFLLLASALGVRFLTIAVFPEITTADISDYLPYLIQFSRLVENEGFLIAFPRYIDPHVEFYTFLYPGYIYAVYGDNGFPLIRIINACLSVVVLPLLNEINKIVFNKQFKRWQAVVILFWPSYLFFSVELGRTVVGIVSVLLSVYSFLMIVVRYKIKFTFLFIAASTAVVMTRVYYAVYPFGLVLGMYLYKSYLDRQSYSQIVATTSIVSVGSAIGIYLFPYQLSIERINSLAAGIAHGESAYLTSVYPTSLFDLIWYIPLQAIYFQFSPFIWDTFRIGGYLAIIAFFQATLVILFLVATANKMGSPLINWKFGLLILIVFIVALLLGVGVKNTGSAIRWRLPSELLIIAISSTIVDYEYLNKDDRG